MLKTKWRSVIFTAYKFFDSKELLFFVVLEDIHTEGFAVSQHSLQGNAALPRQSVGRPFWRPAAGCRRHGRWCSSKTTPSSCCAVCRRTSSPPTAMAMRDTSGRCRRRAACVPVAHRSGRRRPGPDPDGLSPGSDRSAVSAGPLPAGLRGLPGAVLTGEGCSDVAFPRDIGSPILTKHFTRWSNSPTCQVTGRKVRSWNVIVPFSHCPTPPDVFMILRKLPRHKDAIYYRQKTIRLRPCEPEPYCLPLRMSLSVF